jgi:hypothetical protein
MIDASPQSSLAMHLQLNATFPFGHLHGFCRYESIAAQTQVAGEVLRHQPIDWSLPRSLARYWVEPIVFEETRVIQNPGATNFDDDLALSRFGGLRLGPFLLGVSDAGLGQGNRGAFLLRKESVPPRQSWTAALEFEGLLVNGHAPDVFLEIGIQLTHHAPGFQTFPFRTMANMSPSRAAQGMIVYTGRVTLRSCIGETAFSHSQINLNGPGFSVAVAGTLDHPPLPNAPDPECLMTLWANLDEWEEQRAGSHPLHHVSTWTRTYAPLLDPIRIHYYPKSGHIMGYWKSPTLSAFVGVRT